jgi:hypothetical protein
MDLGTLYMMLALPNGEIRTRAYPMRSMDDLGRCEELERKAIEIPARPDKPLVWCRDNRINVVR